MSAQPEGRIDLPSMVPTILSAVLAATPNVGDVAPDFKAQDTEGNELHLEALTEKGPVIVAFFPKAFTPG